MPSAGDYEQQARAILARYYPETAREYVAALNQWRLESAGFRPDVMDGRWTGPAGERGGWGIIPAYHPQCPDPVDLEQGTAYRCAAVNRIQAATSNLRKAIASWNCGEPTVAGLAVRLRDLWETELPATTKGYLRDVMEGALLNLPLPVSPPNAVVADIVLPFDGAIVRQAFGMTDYARSGAYGGGPHTGIDVGGAPSGTLLCAAVPGRVDWHGWSGNYGYVITTAIGGGRYLSYCHTQGPAVIVGNTLRRGDVIGYLGFTGRVDPPGEAGTHTHLELRTGTNELLDPTPYLRAEVPPPPKPPPTPPTLDYRALYLTEKAAQRDAYTRDEIEAAIRRTRVEGLP